MARKSRTNSKNAKIPDSIFIQGLVTGGKAEDKRNKGGVVTGYIMHILSFMHTNVLSMNNSKYFAGIVMIMLNLGSKVVSVNFSSSAQEYLKHGASKQLFIFSMAWMGTRDIYTSIILTAAFTILSDYLFNEESSMCVVPKRFHMLKKEIDTNNDGIISESELQAALKVLQKAKNLSNGSATSKQSVNTNTSTASVV